MCVERGVYTERCGVRESPTLNREEEVKTKQLREPPSSSRAGAGFMQAPSTDHNTQTAAQSLQESSDQRCNGAVFAAWPA